MVRYATASSLLDGGETGLPLFQFTQGAALLWVSIAGVFLAEPNVITIHLGLGDGNVPGAAYNPVRFGSYRVVNDVQNAVMFENYFRFKQPIICPVNSSVGIKTQGLIGHAPNTSAIVVTAAYKPLK